MRIQSAHSTFGQRKRRRSTFGHAACTEAVDVMQAAEQYGCDRSQRMNASDL